LDEYAIVKWLHIVSSTILFGTGLGSAFYMFTASRSRDPHVAAFVLRYVVIADWIFTATAVVIQPLTGLWLAYLGGYALRSHWLLGSILLFLLAGACWLPVVWLQIHMRDMARDAAAGNTELPALYWRFFRFWIALGIPAFTALLVVFYLMVAKPV
jgi:uncharacterized membrane protein